jgi:hypothetical protein
MRKILIAALGLASFGALASVQEASAAYHCKSWCAEFYRDPYFRPIRCLKINSVCTGTDTHNPGPVSAIQQPKVIRPK